MVPLSPAHEHPHVIHPLEECRQPDDGCNAEEFTGQRDHVAGREAPRHSEGPKFPGARGNEKDYRG